MLWWQVGACRVEMFPAEGGWRRVRDLHWGGPTLDLDRLFAGEDEVLRLVRPDGGHFRRRRGGGVPGVSRGPIPGLGGETWPEFALLN